MKAIFSEEDYLYRIFIEYETINMAGAPSEKTSVLCEVAARDRKIVTYVEVPI